MRGARNGLAEGLVIKPMYVLAKLKELGNGQRLPPRPVYELDLIGFPELKAAMCHGVPDMLDQRVFTKLQAARSVDVAKWPKS